MGWDGMGWESAPRLGEQQGGAVADKRTRALPASPAGAPSGGPTRAQQPGGRTARVAAALALGGELKGLAHGELAIVQVHLCARVGTWVGRGCKLGEAVAGTRLEAGHLSCPSHAARPWQAGGAGLQSTHLGDVGRRALGHKLVKGVAVVQDLAGDLQHRWQREMPTT